MEISPQDILFSFLGGLGIFLFGIRFMSSGLQSIAGDKMRTILEQGTKTPIRGVLTGAFTTALIQSSSATTVLTVGLVNARLLNLRQAIGVILGANLGTTLTAFIIGIKLEAYALPIVGIGALLYLFAKNKKVQLSGQALLGFGALFLGLTIMGDGMRPLKDLPVFIQLMTSIEQNALIGVLIGMISTFIVQSSTATIGVLQGLAYQGAVTFEQAVPILFGDNVGTTITALLAAIGTSVAAKRAALTHFIFNLLGVAIFLPLFIMGFFTPMVIFITNNLFAFLPNTVGAWEVINVRLQIAQTHGVFNLANTLIHLPLVPLLAYIVSKLIPDKTGELEIDEAKPQFIDKRFLNNPDMALSLATRETIRMGHLAIDALNNALEYFETRSQPLYQRAMVLEEAIDNMEREITDYLVLVSEKKLSKEGSNRAYEILQSLNDLERIGDHSENIVELADYATKYKATFSDQAKEELQSMVELTSENLKVALEALESDSKELAKQVVQNEIMLNKLEKEYRKSHIRRLNERICDGNAGAVFLDLLSNLERIGDHARNIAGYVLGEY